MPGIGFGGVGHFRLTYCDESGVIECLRKSFMKCAQSNCAMYRLLVMATRQVTYNLRHSV
jgi:hypothetical protein